MCAKAIFLTVSTFVIEEVDFASARGVGEFLFS